MADNLPDIDRQAPVALHWLNTPANPSSGQLYGNSHRQFGSIRSAVEFWAKVLPGHQQATAWLIDDGDMDLKAEDLRELYRRSQGL